MGCRPYQGDDVQQGIDGFAKVTPPAWTGWKKPIWCHLYYAADEKEGIEVHGVGVFGWDDPGTDKPSVLDWDDFSRSDQEKLLTTIIPYDHKHFPLKN